jgi:hypothetical protein
LKRNEAKQKAEAAEADGKSSEQCGPSQSITKNTNEGNKMQCRERYGHMDRQNQSRARCPPIKDTASSNGMRASNDPDLSFHKTIAAVDRCQTRRIAEQAQHTRGRLKRRNGQKNPMRRRSAKSSKWQAVDNIIKL